MMKKICSDGIRSICSSKRLRRVPETRGLARHAVTKDNHYARVNETYHSAWFYDKGSEYEAWQLDQVTSTFAGLGRHAELADIGGGTGRFAHLLFKNLRLERKVLCVDPFKEMLELAKQQQGVRTLQQDAITFATSAKDASFDGYLLKEVVHHIPIEKVDLMFRSLFRCGRPGAVCTVVTRPKYDTDYPFMEQAKQVWIENQEDPSVYALGIERAGFVGCRTEVHSFKVQMPMEQWIGMIESRMWSTFSEANFSQAQLKTGIQEILETCATDTEGNIEFEERLVLISASKPLTS